MIDLILDEQDSVLWTYTSEILIAVQEDYSRYLYIEGRVVSLYGVANGASKTMGLAKFSSNFMGLAVLFFSSYVHLTVSIFSQSSIAVSGFCKAKKVSNYPLVCLVVF